jgi:hypothetical protein
MDDSSVSTISTYNGSNLISACKTDVNEDLSTDIYRKSVLDNYLNNERIHSAVYNAKISDSKYVESSIYGNDDIASGLGGSAYIIDGLQGDRPSVNSLNGGGMITEKNELSTNDDYDLKHIFGSDSDDDFDDMKFNNHTSNRAYESTDNQNNQPMNGADRSLNLDHDPHGSYLRSKETYKDTNHLNKGHKSDKFTIDFDDDFNDIFGSSRSASPSPETTK